VRDSALIAAAEPAAQRSVLDYVIRRFNASSAGLKEPEGLMS